MLCSFFKTLFFISFLSFSLFMTTVSCFGPSKPEMTTLQMRAMQTREYDISNTKLVMKALANSLQDDGFILKNANTELGTILASKEIQIENKAMVFLSFLDNNGDRRWNTRREIEASANVSEFGERTKVRIIFQQKTYDNFGVVSHVSQIMNPSYYQDFFSQVDKGIFLQKENI